MHNIGPGKSQLFVYKLKSWPFGQSLTQLLLFVQHLKVATIKQPVTAAAASLSVCHDGINMDCQGSRPVRCGPIETQDRVEGVKCNSDARVAIAH